MKKVFIIVLGIIVILLTMAILAWTILPSIVSHKLSKTAGVSISIDDIKFSSSMLEVENIKVRNPKGYNKVPKALSAKTFTANTPITHYFDENIVIDEINLNDVYVGLEFDSPKTNKGNWTTIMNNVSKNTGSEKEKAQSKGKTTKILIKKLIISDLNIELAYKTGGKPNLALRPIDRIELYNISSEGGIPTNQIMNIIMQETLRNIFSKEGLQNMLEGILNPNDADSGVMDTLKSLFSEAILLDNDWGDFEFEVYQQAQ